MRRFSFESPRFYFLLIIGSLLVLGMAQAAWNMGLKILGTINTSEASMSFIGAFTDDDGVVDDPDLDKADIGSCPEGGRSISSCDPKEQEGEAAARWEKDIARCNAAIESDGLRGTIEIVEGYPGYRCRGWFTARNTGSLPLRISGLNLNGAALKNEAGQAVDLDGDNVPDARLRISGIEICRQVDPGDELTLALDQLVLGGVSPATSLEFTIDVIFAQWNVPCDGQAPVDTTESNP